MLVVVLLQCVEVAIGMLGGIDVVQGVVADIICHVSDEEEAPEEGGNDGIAERDHLFHRVESEDESAHCQEGRIDQSVAKWEKEYGSLGSMWWIPCIM